ncbi:Cuticle protein 10.9 [Nymphon striatum]|nr:Cuticle protein 10.9 [Nymphon striatum]
MVYTLSIKQFYDMLEFIVLAVVVAVATAQGYGQARRSYAPARPQYGYQEDYSEATPYKFSYDIKDDYNNQMNRQESGDGYGNVQGSYGYQDAYGVYRQVEYTADDYGFKANIKTNEPGTANQNPADVSIYAEPIEIKHQPKRTQGYAPAHQNSYAPVRHQTAYAPVRHQTSYAPAKRVVAHAPVRHQTSYAPAKRVVAHAPVRHQTSYAPAKRVVAHAPVRHQTSYAPAKRVVAHAPVRHQTSYAPAKRVVAHAPVRHQTSYAPVRHQTSYTPAKRVVSYAPFIVLAVVVAVATAQGYGQARRSYAPARPQYGYQEDYSEATPYKFSYDITDDYNNQINRQESGDGYGNVQGTYGYQDAYGVYRQVEYTADDYGFKANIKTNEPGTANQNPADVSIYAEPIEIKHQPKRTQGYAPAHQTSYAPVRHQTAYAPVRHQTSYAPVRHQTSYAPAKRVVAYAPAKRVVSYAPLIVLAVVVAVATAQGYGQARRSYAPARPQYGYQEDYSEATPYKFSYDITDDYNNQMNRQESGDGYGNVQGTYGYQDAYGIYRQVEYTADDYGFKANIKTNEPGTANQNPADVSIYAEPIEIKHQPKRTQGYAPTHQNSYAPVRHQTSYAPAKKVVAHSPVRHQTSYAPVRHQTSYAPAKRVVAYAPAKRVVSYAPLIVLAVVVAVATAQGYGQARRSYAPARPQYGYQEDYSEATPYKFSYDIKDDYNNQMNRQESGDGYGNVQGSYGYQDAYGVYRQVEYTADDYGFKANIKTNEPGTANQNPADVSIYAEPIEIKHQPKRTQGYAPAHQTSYAPVRHQTAYAPVRHQTSYAPAKRVVAHAPVRHQTSYAPAKRVVAYAPAKRVVSYAPQKTGHCGGAVLGFGCTYDRIMAKDMMMMMMLIMLIYFKKLIVLAVVVAVATAQGYGQARRSYAPARPQYSYQEDYSEATPYKFSYDITDDYNNQMNRQESGDGYGNVQGTYGYQDAYGVFRQVEYTADDYGFKANIKTNEPGTANQSPADVSIYAEPIEIKHQPKRTQGYAPTHQTSYAPVRHQTAYAPVRHQTSYTPAKRVVAHASAKRVVSYAPTKGVVSYAPTKGVVSYAPVKGVVSYDPAKKVVSYAPAKGVVSYAPLVVLAVVVAVASAQGYGHARRSHAPASPSYGYQEDYDDYNNQMNRQESGDGYGNVQGSYGYQDAYGVYRQVEYTADDYGFKANIKTNEPGTANQNPADVSIYADPIEIKHQPKKTQGYAPAHQNSYAPVRHQTAYAPVRHQTSYAPAKKVLIVLAVVVAVATAQGYGHARRSYAPVHAQARPSYGYQEDYSEATPFEFSYDIKDDYNNQMTRQESGDGYGNVQGSYGYQDAYGVYRQVEYTADDYGFKANIKTNEPGTANQNPADVSIYADPIEIKHQPKTTHGYAPAHQNSYAPVRHQTAYAPVRHQTSYAPARRVVSHAPAKRVVSYAPAPVHRQSGYGHSTY